MDGFSGINSDISCDNFMVTNSNDCESLFQRKLFGYRRDLTSQPTAMVIWGWLVHICDDDDEMISANNNKKKKKQQQLLG